MYLVIYQNGQEVNRINNPKAVTESLMNHLYCWAKGIGDISKVKVKDYNDEGEIAFYNKKFEGKYVFKEVPFRLGYLNSYKLISEVENETKSKQKTD